MLTSADRPENVLCCRKLNIAAYLTKPVTQAELLRAVLDAFQKKALRQQIDKSTQIKTIPKSRRSLRILLTEDNMLNQQVARGMFEEMGHTVTSAMNGQEAVEKFKEGIFDLVFMDIQMPVLNGYEATALIQEFQKDSPRRTPIIAMTAHAMSGDREKCLAAGMDDYISKPIRSDGLFLVAERNSRRAPASMSHIDDLVPTTPEIEFSPSPGPGAPTIKVDEANPLVINVQLVLGRFGGNRTLLQKAAGMFPPQATILLDAVDRARNLHDLPGLQTAAHTIKGICRMFEANDAAQAAVGLEAAARSGNVGTEQQAERLRSEITRAISALNQFDTISS